MLTRMFQRRDISADWASDNPVLGPGEIGLVMDPGEPIKIKIGDGETAFEDLDFFGGDVTPSLVITTKEFSRSGTLAILAGTARSYIEHAGTITLARASVGVAPTGADLIVIIKKNGATIITLTIAAGTYTDLDSPLSIAVSAGDYLTLSVTQIGSSEAGAYLTVALEVAT